MTDPSTTPPTAAFEALSLGGGVQSSTLALLAAHGLLPRLDAIMFADTSNEMQETYEWLNWLGGELQRLGSVPITRVTAGDLLHDHLTSGNRVSQAPLFIRNADGVKGRIMRRCSRDYKVYPVRREGKAQMLAAGFTHMNQWVGISLDETERMNSKGPGYITTVWPLVDLRMTRGDCLNWMKAQGYPTPPRSACYWCPQANDARWLRMRDTQPAEWEKACAADDALRAKGIPGIDSPVFIHVSLRPLREAPLANDNQGELFDPNMSCEGGCFL